MVKNMRKKILLFANPDFDKKYLNGISRLYQLFCRENNYNLEIIDEYFLKNHKPDANKNEILVIAGGDGTIHRVINIIPDEYLSDYKFGIIPAGTANEFAKSLNLPYFFEEALALIAKQGTKNNKNHKIAVVDNNYKFLTGMLYGVACQALQSTSRESKIFWGNFAYNLPGLMALTCFSNYVKHFRTDFGEFFTGYLIINNASLISKDISSQDLKDEDSDLFSFIYIKPGLTTSDIFRLLVKNHARFNILQDSAIFYSQKKEINIEFDEKSLFMLDGEIYEFSSPLNIKHHEKSIEVICGYT